MQVIIREPQVSDEANFLMAMQRSKSFHYPWVKAPLTTVDFKEYLLRSSEPSHKHFLVCDENENIVGVFNINEIVRGSFQSAYLGFYAVMDYAAKGYMSAGLKFVLAKAFTELDLHRLEANIQPENSRSIALVIHNKFRKEGYSPRYLKINDVWCDHERWAITYEDWLRP